MKPRIVFFMPVAAIGGAERHTVDLRARLRDRGWDTRLVVYGSGRSENLLIARGAEDIVHLDIRGMSQPAGWLRAWRALRNERASVIVAVNQTPLIVSIVTRRLGATRAKVVEVFHTTLLRRSELRMFPAFRLALRAADALVYVSGNQRDYWERRGLTARAVQVIRNGIDQSRFAPDGAGESLRRDLGFSELDFVIGLAAALRPEKNVPQLIDALHRLRAGGVPAKVLLIGDGTMRDRIIAHGRERGVEAHVVLAGEQADVRPWMGACDVGVLCSTAVETFSLAAIEFLACGVPMIMSDIGGASEIVRPGVNGFLFEAGDTDGLVSRLTAVADPTLRGEMAARARASVESLTSETMVDAYEALLGDLVGAPRSYAEREDHP